MIGTRTLRLLSVIGTAAFALTLFVAPAQAQEYKEAFNTGLASAKAGQMAPALQQFTAAANGAKAAGDTDTEKSANKIIGQIEYKLGLTAIRADRHAEALKHFDNGIARYPVYAKNVLGRGLALKKLDRVDEAMTAFTSAIKVGEANGDRKTARTAEEAIRDHYVFLASSTLSRSGAKASRADADAAMAHLAKLQEYVSADSDTYYYLAESHKARGEFQETVTAADKALELHRGSRTDKAKIYFVKGEALMQIGDSAGARTAFRAAAVGSYKASAEHFLETLGT